MTVDSWQLTKSSYIYLMVFSLAGIVVISFNFDYFERSDNFRNLNTLL